MPVKGWLFMNRQQRRHSKKVKKANSKPHRVMTAEEKQQSRSTINFTLELGIGACLIALSRTYGFGKKRAQVVCSEAGKVLDEFVMNSQDDSGYAVRTLRNQLRKVFHDDFEITFANDAKARKCVNL